MEMHDIVEKLNDLGMTVSENFFIQFVLNSLPSQFIQFKIYYNTHKESWSMNELISQCVQEEERLKQILVVHVISQECPKRKKAKKKNKKFGNPPKKNFCKLKYIFYNKERYIKKDCEKRKK